ncbi:MAG: hypothetical protein JXB05_24790 [Myxococcaceae bacterium]|nr:hypothetical protein [Myxococcaceae bacterium]
MAYPLKNAILNLMAGIVAGSIVTGCAGGIVAYVMVKKAEHGDRKGWGLVPVVVAARDIAPGEKVPLEAISQRPIPEQFITPSVVKPDSAVSVGFSRLTAPLVAGDPMNWGFFSTAKAGMATPGSVPRGDPAVWEACDDALAASPAAPKRERTPADIRARLMSEAKP